MENEVTAPAEEASIVETAAAAPKEPVTEPDPKVDAEPPSRMDAIAKAFEAVDKASDTKEPDPQAETKAAETKPEETRNHDGSSKESQPRNADGTFKAKVEDTAAEKAEDKPEAEKAAEAPKPEDGAPARFSADAKAEWEKAPPSVRGEINRAVRELETGIQQKDAQLAPLKPFMDMAEKAGRKLPEVVQGYVALENELSRDIKSGLTEIARTFGMTLEDMIAKAGGPASESSDKDREIVHLTQKVSHLEHQLNGLNGQFDDQRLTAIESQVAAFAQSHPRFEELEGEMLHMIETGYATSLEDAYRKAALLNPAPQPVTPAPTPPAQTRQVRSVTGAPSAGSDPAYRKPSESRREAIARGFAQVNL